PLWRRRRMGYDRAAELAGTEHDSDNASTEIGGLQFVHEITQQGRFRQTWVPLVPRLQKYSDKVILAPCMVGLPRKVRRRRKRAAHDFIALRGQIDFVAAGIARDDCKLCPQRFF